MKFQATSEPRTSAAQGSPKLQGADRERSLCKAAYQAMLAFAVGLVVEGFEVPDREKG